MVQPAVSAETGNKRCKTMKLTTLIFAALIGSGLCPSASGAETPASKLPAAPAPVRAPAAQDQAPTFGSGESRKDGIALAAPAGTQLLYWTQQQEPLPMPAIPSRRV